MADRYDDEVRRLTAILATIVRIAGRTRQSLEVQLGLSSGYLSKILGGTVDLRARHVLAIVEALGMEPAEFFRLAFPRHRKPSESGTSARRLIEDVQAALGQEPAEGTEANPNFDEQVKRSLGRLLGLSVEEPEAE
ncbi:MAG TPA: helix-turn-helix transcriptional regulator [Thermoanaerobaculia bacterium]|nr:helix-turn-helix transcriptional regulator [Thermoanaerobaculia bacterium]